MMSYPVSLMLIHPEDVEETEDTLWVGKKKKAQRKLRNQINQN